MKPQNSNINDIFIHINVFENVNKKQKEIPTIKHNLINNVKC